MDLDEDDWLNLDTSQYPFPNVLWHVKPPLEIAIKTTAMLIIGITGIFLNSVILIILIRNRWLWSASNYLVGNLAVVDLLTLVFCPWFMLVRDFYQNFVLKNFGCQFEGFMQATLLLASVAAVMLVSYDRLASAALTADARITKSMVPKLIVISWLLCMLLSLPWIIAREYTERQWKDHLETYCVEDVQVLGIYWHFIISFLVWLPLGLMVVTLDTSQYPFPNVLWHVKPPLEIAIKTTAMLIIGITGIFLNSVILIILIRNRWLWSASNYLVGNLAVVDLLTLVFCPWFMLVRDFYQNFVLKNFGCQFEGFMQATLLLASVAAVMLVSYDRLASAALTADARITKSMVPKLIVISWLLCMLLSLPWIIAREYTERQWKDHLETYCVEDVQVLGIYWHFIISFLVWIPLGLMVVTYGTIMWRLEWSARQLSSRGGGKVVAKAKRRAMRIMAGVLLAALLCRIPYTVLIYWRNRLGNGINSVEGSYDAFWFVANYLMYTNSAVNPLIYGFTNSRFRKAMDRTPGVRIFKFGSWCCVCTVFRKRELITSDKNTEKIFVIEGTPRPNKKLTNAIKNFLHINKDTVDFSVKADEVTGKPTRITPVKTDQI